MAFRYATTESGAPKFVYHVIKRNRPVKTFCGQTYLHNIVDYPPKRHWICMRCMEAIAASLRDRAWRLRQIRELTKFER